MRGSSPFAPVESVDVHCLYDNDVSCVGKSLDCLTVMISLLARNAIEDVLTYMVIIFRLLG